MMRYLSFLKFEEIFPSLKEIDFLEKELDEELSSDIKFWYYINIFFPLFIVLFSIIIFAVVYLDTLLSFLQLNVREGIQINQLAIDKWKELKDFILNGNIPLISVTILVSNIFILGKYNEDNEKKLGYDKITKSRSIYTFYIIILLFISTGLYFIENFKKPEKPIGTVIYLLTSIVVLYFSVRLSLKLFYLQESILVAKLSIKNTFDLEGKNLKGKRLTKKQKT